MLRKICLGFFLVLLSLVTLAPQASAIDLSAGATDLTSVGLPGYYGLRVDCDASQTAALTLAINQAYEPLVNPTNGIPAPGISTNTPPSDPGRVYVEVIWADHDDAPPLGDGQPSWPSTCVKSNAAASAAIGDVGVVSGVPVDGW